MGVSGCIYVDFQIALDVVNKYNLHWIGVKRLHLVKIKKNS